MDEGTITERGKALLRVPPKVERPDEQVFYEAGGESFHTHMCPSEGNRAQHQWRCNSPYCTSLNDLCPDHGGPEPIHVGREPWKR